MNINLDKITALMGAKKTLGIIKQDLSDRFSTLDKALALFHRVYGHTPVKENIYRALVSPNQINILLIGPPASAKTLFMNIIQESCNDVCYFDSANTSGAGLIETLYRNQNAKILIIDEIDKLRKNDLSCLLGLLNNGCIDKALKSVHYKFSMNIKIFATSNSTPKLAPIRSRFQEYILTEYTDDEFIEVVKFCLDKLPAETSEIIGKILLSHDKKDVRTAISISNLIQQNDSMEDIARVIENYLKYSTQKAVDYN